ncbi:MAG: hypothetical protein HRT35_34240, partial [Algicola sp.]|nr:hypothetical protein [Algicola sp.]
MLKNPIFKKSVKAVLLFACAVVCTTLILMWYFPGVIATNISSAVDYKPDQVANIEMTCFKENAPVVWSYCVNRASGEPASNTLVYHFHGRRGNETWWNDKYFYSGELYSDWKKSGASPPVVVSVSFGPLWLLKEGELLDTFVDVVMPKV